MVGFRWWPSTASCGPCTTVARDQLSAWTPASCTSTAEMLTPRRSWTRRGVARPAGARWAARCRTRRRPCADRLADRRGGSDSAMGNDPGAASTRQLEGAHSHSRSTAGAGVRQARGRGPRVGQYVAGAVRPNQSPARCRVFISAPLVRDRLLGLFALWAERWGKVMAEGVRIDLPLTHEQPAMLCGARRPSVTVALRSLKGRWAADPDPRPKLAAVPPAGRREAGGPLSLDGIAAAAVCGI